MRYKEQFKCCLVIVGLLLALTLGGLAVFSCYEDPFALYHSADYIPPAFNEARGPMMSYSYVTKAKNIILYKPDKILLGSSIVDHGFRIRGSTDLWFIPDPKNTERITALLPKGKKDFFNASVRGGASAEALDFLQHAYANNPHLKEVILGIEWHNYALWNPGNALNPKTGALGKQYVPFSFTMEYLLSPLALKGTWGLFAYQVHLTQLINRIDAKWTRVVNALLPPSSDTSRPAKERFIAVPVPSWPSLLKAESYNSMREYVYSLWFVNFLHYKAATADKDALLHHTALMNLRQIAVFCKARNITLKVYISPQHPLFWVMTRRFGLEPMLNDWLRQLAAITPVYDAAELVDFSSGVDQYFDAETLHFNNKGGEALLPALTQEPVSPTLIYTDSRTIEARIRWRAAALDRWLADHPNAARSARMLDVKALEKVADPLLTNPDVLLPTPYEPHYKGFVLYKFLWQYVALPESEKPPFDLYTLTQNRYRSQINAPTLDTLVSKVDTFSTH